jgi:uroporphyrinogen decarboxylase
MKTEMTHRERIRAAIEGKEVDRLPVSMWRHFFDKELSAESLAETMLTFQKRFDWDFMKVNPRASYHVEDWGVKMGRKGDVEPEVLQTPVKVPEDWLKFEKLDVNRGVLKEQLDALEIITRNLNGDLPFIMTVFTPLSIAARLVGSEKTFLHHLRVHTDKVNQALDVITDTFIDFSKACFDRGVSGLFFATTAWATSERLSEKEYTSFARPYDLRLLKALPKAEFNVLHVCRDHNLLRGVSDYPVHAFSWDARGKGNPSLAEGKAMVAGRTVIGGIAHDEGLIMASVAQLKAEVKGMRVAIGDKGWILGPGCTFPPKNPEAHLRAIREAVEVDAQ